MGRAKRLILAEFVPLFLACNFVLATELIPMCLNCTCWTPCSTTCIAANEPGPGTHTEICDMWLCIGHPDCDSPASQTDSEQLDSIFAIGGNDRGAECLLNPDRSSAARSSQSEPTPPGR